MARTRLQGDLSRAIPDSLAQPPNLFDDSLNVSVSGLAAKVVVLEAIEHVRQMARPGTDIENRRSDSQNVVNLARRNDADEHVAHDDDVKISRREHR